MNSWANGSIFYHIYPLGFCGAPRNNDFVSPVCSRIKKVECWIEHIKSLGVNSVYFGPVFESTFHGYDTADYFKIDRRLGTNKDFAEVVQAFHEKGIRVIIDGVFNHVGRKFDNFKKLLEEGETSEYRDWFSKVNFFDKSPYGDPFSYEGWEGHYDLVKLNLQNQDVKNYLFSAVEYWIDKFEIDGLRLDVAYCLDRKFTRELSIICKQKNPEFLLLGEMINGDYNMLANNEMLDTVTNYECYKGLYSSHNEKNYFEIAYAFNRQYGQYGIYKNIFLYNFVDNHDVTRIGSILKNKNHLKTIYAMLFTMPGMPSIYYGSEFGIEGKKENSSDDALRPELDLNKLYEDEEGKKLNDHISVLAKIRSEHDALKMGKYKQIYLNHEQIVFLREAEDEKVVCAINASEKEIEVKIKVQGSIMCDLLNDLHEFKVMEDGLFAITIPAYGTRIMTLS